APAVVLDAPVAASFVTRATAVHGGVEDLHLSSYVVRAARTGDPAVELARGAQSRSDFDLASLAALTDGAYVLTVEAEDAAENRRQADLRLTGDSVPATARLDT